MLCDERLPENYRREVRERHITGADATSMPSHNTLSHLLLGPIEMDAVACATGALCPRSQIATNSYYESGVVR